MRAILTGAPYPLTLLSTLIMRLRADHDVNALRVAILKSILIRNFNMEVPVSFDSDNREPGYLLGRFSPSTSKSRQLHSAATSMRPSRTNFTVRPRRNPARFFGCSTRLRQASVEDRQDRPGSISPEKRIGAIMELMSPGTIPFPRAFLIRARPCSASAITTSATNFSTKPRHQNLRSQTEDAAYSARKSLRHRLPLRRHQRQSERRSGRRQYAADRPGDERGLVSDVSLKRKIRNYVELARGDAAGLPHLRAGGRDPQRKAREAYKAVRPDDEKVAKDKKLNPQGRRGGEARSRKFMCDNFFDVRTFGAVMTTGINAGQVRGPVQIAFARSVEPIMPLEISITRMAATNEKEKAERDKADEGDERTENRTMGRKHIVPYGLYRAHMLRQSPSSPNARAFGSRPRSVCSRR